MTSELQLEVDKSASPLRKGVMSAFLNLNRSKIVQTRVVLLTKPVPPGPARVRRSVMFSPSVTVLRGAKCGYVAFGLSTGNLDAGTSTAFILYNHIRTVKGANETPTTHKRTRTHGNANTHTRRVIHYSHSAVVQCAHDPAHSHRQRNCYHSVVI